ncbi:ABC transporter ATP-binding protein [Shinella pollutisoli]|uniref:ABC transporter ATP-binding protein n=1 Tax=Shinella pollutisoli TaxID=2250594 RepID=A0ABV7DHJ8_9HYPH|nr:ABC transporter ATP-binding protein [Shinella pollutisoli]
MALAFNGARPSGALAGHADTGADIDISGLTKTYGDFTALRNVDLSMRPGEFVAVLGSSGSGKSTLLMALAGFIQPDSGSIRVRGREVLGDPANRRGFGVVFQNYALFPHMTVFENVSFPLRLRKIARSEVARRTEQVLETVKLGGYGDRPIAALSGGQRQRVALARAIVYEPQVLLMDEPLSALDKSLREEMQIEIRELHEKLHITTLYVTHDQREALTMADRIAVMSKGEIMQIDTPERIYREPSSEFVARFLGEAVVFSRGDAGRAFSNLPPAPAANLDLVMIRGEDFRLEPAAREPCSQTTATVAAVVFQGDSWLARLTTAGGLPFDVRIQRADSRRVASLTGGAEVTLYVRHEDIHFLRVDP